MEKGYSQANPEMSAYNLYNDDPGISTIWVQYTSQSMLIEVFLKGRDRNPVMLQKLRLLYKKGSAYLRMYVTT